jgi:hypothetical protein
MADWNGFWYAAGYDKGRRYRHGNQPRANSRKTKFSLLLWFLGWGW